METAGRTIEFTHEIVGGGDLASLFRRVANYPGVRKALAPVPLPAEKVLEIVAKGFVTSPAFEAIVDGALGKASDQQLRKRGQYQRHKHLFMIIFVCTQ